MIPPMAIWWAAARPRTLSAAIAPIVVGVGAAAPLGDLRPGILLTILLAAIAIQVGTNFINDWGDFQRGADGPDREGPKRAVSTGAIAPQSMLRAGLGSFGLAACLGLFLVSIGGWPILWIGVLSILSGLAYTSGPVPLAYHGLGDVFVFVFFGPVAVLGTEWLMVDQLSVAGALASIGIGSLATAILVVNNIRDVDGDAKVGKKTLIVRRGRIWGRRFYLALLSAAFALPMFLVLGALSGPAVLLSGLALPLAWGPWRIVREQGSGVALNEALAGTAQLQLAYAVLLAVGLAF